VSLVERERIGGKTPDGDPAYLSPWTFEAPQVRDALREYLRGTVLNACAGETELPYSGTVHRNDVDPGRWADTHHDVRELDEHLSERFEVVVYDPPYSKELAQEHYRGHHVGRPWEARPALAALTAVGGDVICFHFSSDGLEGWDGWRRIETRYFNTPNLSGGDLAMTVDRKVVGEQATLDEAAGGRS